jgi:hypothetical protein
MKKRNPYFGKWRITQMEMWDQEFVDMETEGHFNFEEDELGSFQFGLVQGQIDYRMEKTCEIERLEFSWEGQSDFIIIFSLVCFPLMSKNSMHIQIMS